MPILFILLAILLAACGVVLLHTTSLRATAQANRPNVVVIMSDDQDVDSLPAMRNLLTYPGGSWLSFANAYANNSICTPSRATLLTGQYSHHHGAIGNNWGAELDDDNTLPVWFHNAGYRTAVIGKYVHDHPNIPPDGISRVPGWDRYLIDNGAVDDHTAQAVAFITEAQSPFFLWLAYRAPHEPADPPPRYAAAAVYTPPDRPNFNEADLADKPEHVRGRPLLGGSTIAALRAERLASQRELLAVDDGVQTVIDTLTAAGQLDNTLIIYAADNGYSWGAHREVGKLCPYEECSRTPLLIRYPGLGRNRVETHFVSNVDLAATILEYTGVAPGLPQDGRSLIPLLTGTADAWDDAVLLERPEGQTGYYAVRDPSWVYVEYFTGEKELYDMIADPYQLENLAGRPEYAGVGALLAQQLQHLLYPDTPPPQWLDLYLPAVAGSP